MTINPLLNLVSASLARQSSPTYFRVGPTALSSTANTGTKPVQDPLPPVKAVGPNAVGGAISATLPGPGHIADPRPAINTVAPNAVNGGSVTATPPAPGHIADPVPAIKSVGPTALGNAAHIIAQEPLITPDDVGPTAVPSDNANNGVLPTADTSHIIAQEPLITPEDVGPNTNGVNPVGSNTNGVNPVGPNTNGVNPVGSNTNGVTVVGPNTNGVNPVGVSTDASVNANTNVGPNAVTLPIHDRLPPIFVGVPATVAPNAVSNVVNTPAPNAIGGSISSSAQLQTTNLLGASTNFAQLGSLLQVAQSGTEQVGTILQQLQSLAQQASDPETVPNVSATLDSEFQELISRINSASSGSSFNGVSLLDGSLASGAQNGALPSALGAGSQAAGLSLPDLSASALLGTNAIDLITPKNASDALETLTNAVNTVTATQNGITQVQGQVSFAAASVNTALANGVAADSTLTEADLHDGVAPDVLASLTANISATAQTQTANLSSNLLNILQE